MTPLAATKPTAENLIDYTKKDSFDALYHELAKGIHIMKNDEVYTINQAWDKIDKNYHLWKKLTIKGFSIYYKSYSTYLMFFVVDVTTIIVIRILKDRMYGSRIYIGWSKFLRDFKVLQISFNINKKHFHLHFYMIK